MFNTSAHMVPFLCWPPIIVLNLICSPTYVFYKIALGVIYSIKCMPRRAVAYFGCNVGNEDNKVIPSRIVSYSLTSIPFVSGVIGVIASIAHHCPSGVQIVVWFMLWGKAMLIVGFCATTRTVATSLKRAGKRVSCDGMKFSAIALAEPDNFTAPAIIGWSDCDQSTEALACDINRCGHRTAPTVRGQVARPVRPTLASLRTIAQGFAHG